MLENDTNFLSLWLFRRRAIIARNRQTCAVIKAEENQPCSPFGFHCKYGLRCKQIPQVNQTVSLRQLFFPTNDFHLHNLDYPQYGEYGGGQLFRGEKNRRKAHFKANRAKRQTRNNQNQEYYDEYPQYPQENEEPLDIDMLFGITLRERLKKRLERQFRKHQCVKFELSDGSGEACSSSVDCRCGEYCFTNARNPSLQGICRLAECSTNTVEQNNSTVCQTYTGFNNQ